MSKQYDIEIGLLSKLLETGDLVTVEDKQIKPYYFTGTNKKVFNFIKKYHKKNGDMPTKRVINLKYPDMEFETYLDTDSLVDKLGTEEPITYWCDEIRKKNKHNILCDVVEDVTGLLQKKDTEKAYDLVKKTILKIESTLEETNAINLSADSEDRKAQYLKRKENQGMLGISTGIPLLDYILKGLQPKQLITLIAKTGTGKSWIFVLLASYAVLNGYKVFFGVTEMAEEQIEDRLEAMLFGMTFGEFNYGRFKAGKLTPQEEEFYFKFLDEIKPKLEDCIIDSVTSVSNLSAKINQYNPDLIFIDSAYLMTDDQGSDQDWLRVAHITRDTKLLAKRIKKPIVINSQADKTTSTKTGPELDNIGFSSAIGQDSDVVLALFRDEQMMEDKESCLKVLKQREGETGKVYLNWDFDTMNFGGIYSDMKEQQEDMEDSLVDI